MLIFMAILTLITAIVAPLLLVMSCYYSERNYKRGRLFWQASLVTGFVYSISFWTTIIMLVYKFLDFIF